MKAIASFKREVEHIWPGSIFRESRVMFLISDSPSTLYPCPRAWKAPLDTVDPHVGDGFRAGLVSFVY